MFFDIDFQPMITGLKNIKIKICYFFSTQNLQDKLAKQYAKVSLFQRKHMEVRTAGI